MLNFCQTRHVFLLFLATRSVHFPANPSSNFTHFEICTCPIPIKPDMQFRFFWNVDLSNFQHIRHVISFFPLTIHFCPPHVFAFLSCLPHPSLLPAPHLCPTLYFCPDPHFCPALHFCPDIQSLSTLHFVPTLHFGPTLHFCPL